MTKNLVGEDSNGENSIGEMRSKAAMAFSKFNFLLLFGLACFAIQVWGSVACSAQVDVDNGSGSVTVRGVVTADGQPLSNASAIMFRGSGLVAEAEVDETGGFEILMESDEPANLLVVANGKLSQFRSIRPGQQTKFDFELKQSIGAIKGRIVDNQGMNVLDAKLRIQTLIGNGLEIVVPESLECEVLVATTDETGTFTFEGFDKSMVGRIGVSGTGIVDSSISSTDLNSKIALIVQPARSVKGKVVDRISGRPVSSVNISAAPGGRQTNANDAGEFELQGLPAFQSILLTASPNGDTPYLSNAKPVPAGNGFDPVEIDIELDLGLWVKCSVKDFTTDGPGSAQVYYLPTPENEQYQTYIQLFQSRRFLPSGGTNAEGEAKVVGIPGPGFVAIVAQGFPPNESVNELSDEERLMLQQVLQGSELTAVARIEPKDLEADVELDFLVSKGRAISIELEDDNVSSETQLIVHRAASKTSFAQSLNGSKFDAEQFQPGETRQLLVHAPRKGLGAIVDVEAEAESPVKVELEPTGSMAGQVVDKNGAPQSGLLMKFEIPTEDGYRELVNQVFTDANGRFEQPSLIAGLKYRVAAIRLTGGQQKMAPRMMTDAPEMDSRWYVAEELAINSGEGVDLGAIVLGGTEQPTPKREPIVRKLAGTDAETESTVLPDLISGVVTNDAGQPLADAMISFNTWPMRTGQWDEDLKLAPIVLAQARSDAGGNFRMTIDRGLESKLVQSNGTEDSSEGDANGEDATKNAALVFVAGGNGSKQILLKDIEDVESLNVRLNREMIVRGKVISSTDEEIQLVTGSRMDVYEVESLKQMIAGLKEGKSLEAMRKDFQPEASLDPLAGGVPLIFQTSSSGAFLVRNIPINAIFEVHAVGKSGLAKTITVISRPLRGFDITLSDGGEARELQGSRIKFDLRQKSSGASE